MGHDDASNNHQVEQHKCSNCELIEEPYEDEYVRAYRHGKQGDCLHRYGSACPISFFAKFTL